MKTKILYFALLVIFCFSCSLDEDDKVNVQRITRTNGLSNAFTDLVYFDNQFFLVYRESDKHAYGLDGVIKLMNSTDGINWKLIKEFSISGIDLRDPKFSVNKNELMLYIHGSSYEGKTLSKFADFRIDYSDGWSKVQNVILDNKIQTVLKLSGNESWPWRVSWLNGRAYTLGYNGVDIFRLYDSDDGLFFKSNEVTYSNEGSPTEATIVANSVGDLYAIVRRNSAPALFKKYDTQKKEFVTLRELPFVLRGPNFLFLNDHQVFFAGSVDNVVVGLYNLETNQYKIINNFGGGDCGYPGMLIKDNVLWLSYYSSDKDKDGTSIYIAKVNIEGLSKKY